MLEIFKNILNKLNSKSFIVAIILFEATVLIILLVSTGIFSNFSSEDKTAAANEKRLDLDSVIHAVTNETSETIVSSIEKLEQRPTPITTTDSDAFDSQSNKNLEDTGIPSRFIISKLGINTSVEHVGLDAEKRMDIPKSFSTVGWYRLGYKIGDSGSAVISGHYDDYFGEPAIFWNIAKLAPGDIINVIDKAGVNHAFKVVRKAVYQFDSFPLQEVFGTAGTPGLNLITCSGEWDKSTKNYSTRTVIYSTKIN